MPLPRDPDFVSRDALLEQIHKKALISGSRIALVGLGGVGSEQLVLEPIHSALIVIQKDSACGRILSPDSTTVTRYVGSLGPCE